MLVAAVLGDWEVPLKGALIPIVAIVTATGCRRVHSGAQVLLAGVH